MTMPTTDPYVDNEIMYSLQQPELSRFFLYISHARRPRRGGRYIDWVIEAVPFPSLPDELKDSLKEKWPFRELKSAKTGDWLFLWEGFRSLN